MTRLHKFIIDNFKVPVDIFTAFSRVGFSADPVHGDGEGRVRLDGDAAEGHGPGGEPLDDVRSRLNLWRKIQFLTGASSAGILNCLEVFLNITQQVVKAVN